MPERKSGWIPWVFVGGFVGVVGVNAVLIWLAVTTFSGLDREAPYARGLGYNDVLAEARDQASLGWHAEIEAAEDRLAIAVSDSMAQPLVGARVSARLERPVDAKLDFETDLVATDAGRYVAFVDWPAWGQWDVLVTIEQAGRRFQQQERIDIR